MNDSCNECFRNCTKNAIINNFENLLVDHNNPNVLFKILFLIIKHFFNIIFHIIQHLGKKYPIVSLWLVLIVFFVLYSYMFIKRIKKIFLEEIKSGKYQTKKKMIRVLHEEINVNELVY